MAILLTNGKYYIAHNRTGAVIKVVVRILWKICKRLVMLAINSRAIFSLIFYGQDYKNIPISDGKEVQ